jgi:hypothetical protein
MQETVLSPLGAWESFYVIVGSSGAALTGLMFVVITLIAERRTVATPREINAFGTPTVVHFCSALFVSTTISAPWKTLSNCGLALGAAGVFGTIYTIIVLQRARRQTGYKAVLEDWIWHTILPFAAYLSYVITAVEITAYPSNALFVIAAATLLLVFIGIHNAWDTVTYLVLQGRDGQPAGGDAT